MIALHDNERYPVDVVILVAEDHMSTWDHIEVGQSIKITNNN